MRRLLIVVLFSVSACAPLSPHESIIGDAGEIAGRTILCPLTLCLSEVHFSDQWKKEEAQRRYWTWYDSLTPAQQAIEDQRKHERALAATQALGLALSHGPILQPIPVQPIYPPIPAMQPPTSGYRAPQQRHCTTQQIGTTAHTSCY